VLAAFVGAALAVLALAAVFALALGGTLQGLAGSIVLGSLRYTADLGWDLPTNLPTLAFPAGSLALFAVFALARGRLARIGVAALPYLELAFGALILYTAQRHPAAPIKYALPWIWVFLAQRVTFERALAVFVAGLQVLQVFPIPGSQLSIGTVALLPIGVVAFAEGLARIPIGRVAARAVVALVASAALGLSVWSAWSAGARYAANEHVALPGCRLLRMPAKQAATFTWLAETLRASDATFVGVGGMNSLYFWAGLEPRTSELTSHAWGLFEQERLVAAHRGAPRLAVVEWSRFLVDRERAGPWFAFVDAELVLLGRFGRHALYGRPGEHTLRNCATASGDELLLDCDDARAVTRAFVLDLAGGSELPATFEVLGERELRLRSAAPIEGFELPAVGLLRGERRSTLPVVRD
jgi:hypothetical protein